MQVAAYGTVQVDTVRRGAELCHDHRGGQLEIVVKIEYKFCPNLTIIDTPGDSLLHMHILLCLLDYVIVADACGRRKSSHYCVSERVHGAVHEAAFSLAQC